MQNAECRVRTTLRFCILRSALCIHRTHGAFSFLKYVLIPRGCGRGGWTSGEMQNAETPLPSAFCILHSPFGILHSALCIHRVHGAFSFFKNACIPLCPS